MPIERPAVEPVLGASFTLPPPAPGEVISTLTFSGLDLRLRTFRGYSCDGSGVLFANIQASLAGYNFHYTIFNGNLLAEKSMWTTRTTSDAHRNKGEIAVKAVADWLTLDWAGFEMFAQDPATGRVSLRHGLSRNTLFFADPKRVPLPFQRFQNAVSVNPE